MSNESLRASDFGADFVWGAATAAYQIEGGHDADGKGPSIWDEFSRRGKIKRGHTGDVACDHYHRMPQDVALMQDLGLGAYRFSISWPRVLPDGTVQGGINEAGFDFYKRLCDELQRRNITPFATLFHWDLPLALQQSYGGWLDRKIADHFAEYAALCVNRLGDYVKDWIILNEPFVFLLLGYGVGYFPPSKIGLGKFLKASHHALLAQGRAARAMDAERSGLHLGTTNSTLAGYLDRDTPANRRALARHDAFFNRLYVDPVVGRGYPVDALPVLNRIERKKFAEPGDLDEIAYDFAFHGINHYSRKVVRSARYLPWLGFRERGTAKGAPRTAMGWEVFPEGLHQVLMKFSEYPEIPALYVTENGSAWHDTLSTDADGRRVHDPERRQYLQDYLAQCLRAKNAGVNLRGYFAWSLLDNLEWREGYDRRFGIVHVDFEDRLQRTIKDSGLWYREFLDR
ncbi:MAG: GH1 family beta-glucosidase [bacterium]|nr:GH1 family beta-glucosidase [bacterium]